MTDDCSNSQCSERDWSGNHWSLMLVWGLPGLIMLTAALGDPVVRGVIWTAMLLWMGGACLFNARQCTRTHCRFTGPFLIVMAGLVAGDAMGALALGAHGWVILGGITFFGFVVLWSGSEQILGKFSR
ncbi:hypothetical protein [Allosphingosinicella sp.]|uniref:hypothetical protein n=1 Tax=Allosphingosinicella sp. TaxID=2823234 RepID=UPI003782EDB3